MGAGAYARMREKIFDAKAQGRKGNNAAHHPSAEARTLGGMIATFADHDGNLLQLLEQAGLSDD